MSSSVFKINENGAGSITTSMVVPAGQTYQLFHVSCEFSAAPTTSESMTITLDANAGSFYDILLYTINPSLLSTTSFIWFPDQPLYLEGGDAIDLAFANTDANTFGVQITAGRAA